MVCVLISQFLFLFVLAGDLVGGGTADTEGSFPILVSKQLSWTQIVSEVFPLEETLKRQRIMEEEHFVIGGRLLKMV